MTGAASPSPSPFTMVTAADRVAVDGGGRAADVAVGLCVDGVCEVPGTAPQPSTSGENSTI